MAFTDYGSSPTGSGGASPRASDAKSPGGYLSHGKLKKQYLDYLSSKREEIDEQINARRYRHGAHYTNEQVEALKRRKQPVVTYNRISRKIDGVVGLVEKMRLDPKAYPRTPKHEQGAELATAVLNYVLDEQEWKAKSPICAADGATEGIGGLEIILETGDRGDREIAFEIVDPENFFYDPRSSRLDFSDARYMGVGKWMDVDQAKEMFPDHADDLDTALDGSELTSNSDKEQKWFSSDQKNVRIVDHWYKHNGEWCYAIYTGAMILMEGKSFLIDEKKKTTCKYLMFSANVDQDGDRYGFVRQLKSAQDEINARRSKGIHELHTRRIIAERGAFDNIEETRREAARPDGVVIRNPGKEALFDDTQKAANLAGQLEFLNEAKAEIENFGPNPALIGTGVDAKSGRAIALMQQAGIAELGPFILALRGWKLRVYRAVFNAVQNHWTGERWVRVTDDNEVAQFIQINGVQTDPMTQQPQMVNAIGSLDVDIILDEGPDHVNAMADTNEALSQVLQTVGPMLSPPIAQAAITLLVETSPLAASAKQKFREASEQANQPSPEKELQAMGAQAEVADKQAAAKLKEAQTIKTLTEAGQPPEGQGITIEAQEYEPPPHLQDAKMVADIDATHAKAEHSRAQAHKTHQDALLAPQQMMIEQRNADEDRRAQAQQSKQALQAKAKAAPKK